MMQMKENYLNRFPEITLLLLFLLLINGMVYGQTNHYTIDITRFSSNKYHEYAPVFFDGGIVYCSNRYDKLLNRLSDNDRVNIYFVHPGDTITWKDSRIFDMQLISRYNDGPVTFDHQHNRLYYSRNIDLENRKKDLFDSRNTLGLYSATLQNGSWDASKAFPYNSKAYSNTTPWYDSLNHRLYFSSTMPGGHGGADLYFSEKTDSGWSEPTNLGPVVNTEKDEAYPFISPSGDLYFASNGHEGLGQMDIFVTRQTDHKWNKPAHLAPPVNSEYDDFGLIATHGFHSGYFSSNRKNSDDIYRFTTLRPQFFHCDTLKVNNYCYRFWDESYQEIDTLPVRYEWWFSDGTRKNGLEVDHCFPEAGRYTVKLNIVDNRTGNLFFTQQHYEFEIRDAVQPFIRSKNAFIKDKEIHFDGLKSYLPKLQIDGYFWDFGDDMQAKEPEVKHAYEDTGNYTVILGVTGTNDSTGYRENHCVWKEVTIFEDYQALALHQNALDKEPDKIMDPEDDPNDELHSRFNAYERNPEKEVFRVEVMSSPERIPLKDSIFNPLRDTYRISEYYLYQDSLYSYTVGDEKSLHAAYPIYNDLVDRGFEQAEVKNYIIAELPQEVVNQINEAFNDIDNAYFGFNETEVAESSYPILDRIVKIMRDNPDIKIEIAAHTDNTGSFEYNMNLSKARAQSIVKYLESEGIPQNRLRAVGYGESRPIATNQTEFGRRKNRRVEFILIDQ
jgi:outer membrane protein OmpA-like peptidoglycan-associated protein